MSDPTIAGLLVQARAAGVDRLDAQLMLTRLLGRPRTWLLAHDDATLSPAQLAAWSIQLARRAAGEPLAYLLGEKEFRGFVLRVDANVLVPRRKPKSWSIGASSFWTARCAIVRHSVSPTWGLAVGRLRSRSSMSALPPR